MLRGVCGTAAFALVLAIGVSSAEAQYYNNGYGMYGWAATPGGDIARGMGVYAMGLGQYDLANAYANSINTDTAMRWNAGVWQAEQLYYQNRYENLKNRRIRQADVAKSISERLKDHPDPADITRGDALNVILAQLTAPKVRLVSLKTSSMALPSRTASEIPFQYASEAVVICLQQLTVENGWPMPLRDKKYETARKAYEKAIDDALRLDLNGDLTPESIAAVRTAVLDLYHTFKANPPDNKEDYMAAETFLKGLAGGVRMLRSPAVETIISEIEKKPIHTVGDLLAFMEMFNLRFAPAKTPQQRALYQNLYTVLVAQRDEVMKKIDQDDQQELAGLPDNVKEGSPVSVFSRMDWDHLQHNSRKQ